ncbi:MAG: hypothetical protein JRH11_16815 [Deltaproteobacteria bacterium]|nr:hypothetical protein [Deltaproteobacteria bacterium]
MTAPAPALTPTPGAPNQSTIPLLLGISVPLVWLPGALLSIMPAMMSVMLFDAPGSTENPYVIGVFISILSFPVLAVVSGISVPLLAFFAHRAPDRPRYRRRMFCAVLSALLPLLSGVSVGVFFALIAGICDGDLRCGY